MCNFGKKTSMIEDGHILHNKSERFTHFWGCHTINVNNLQKHHKEQKTIVILR